MNTKDTALREVDHCIDSAIHLLHKLSYVRAQIKTLQKGEDGRMIDVPGNALGLNAAVERLAQGCREIEKQ